MTEHEVLAAVRALAPAVRERATEAERLCRIPEATIKDLAAAGLFRLLQPRTHGGLAADPAVFYEALRELGRACGSTGWVAGVLGVNSWIVSQLGPRAQDDVWGSDPGARIASSQAPIGAVAPAEGGFWISGRWSFASGCDHAQWALLGGFLRDAGGAPREMRLFLLPRAAYTVDPVWDTVGLRGTGSNDIVVDHVFVPDHHTVAADRLGSATRPEQSAPEPVFRLPMGPVLTTSIAAPIVGMAEAAYIGYLNAARERIRVTGGKVADDPFAQVRIGRAGSEIDAAWLQLIHNVRELYDTTRRGEEPSLALRTRLRRDQVRATERAVYAVDLLMENAGGSALRNGSHDNTLQRAWRDVHAGRGHVTNDPERSLALFGRQALGLDVHDPML
ncbi:monooxygenase [Streptomyces yokosukanensis]|uniref:Monooxygenase n=1 Tax=Streptomyces yokosukanensis TaxID=67386 RepID=A0A101NLF6_9ACTN|nr:3-hydroxy-9,10-secoandrosta-1,3,5(10)-triene-9,17-dione monooxygenase oxygenase subunit [Streptomyces yokosukanensis]KUM95458.1 monooxygenase [Streptomyces yokosukanensis]